MGTVAKAVLASLPGFPMLGHEQFCGFLLPGRGCCCFWRGQWTPTLFDLSCAGEVSADRSLKLMQGQGFLQFLQVSSVADPCNAYCHCNAVHQTWMCHLRDLKLNLDSADSIWRLSGTMIKVLAPTVPWLLCQQKKRPGSQLGSHNSYNDVFFLVYAEIHRSSSTTWQLFTLLMPTVPVSLFWDFISAIWVFPNPCRRIPSSSPSSSSPSCSMSLEFPSTILLRASSTLYFLPSKALHAQKTWLSIFSLDWSVSSENQKAKESD